MSLPAPFLRLRQAFARQFLYSWQPLPNAEARRQAALVAFITLTIAVIITFTILLTNAVLLLGDSSYRPAPAVWIVAALSVGQAVFQYVLARTRFYRIAANWLAWSNLFGVAFALYFSQNGGISSPEVLAVWLGPVILFATLFLTPLELVLLVLATLGVAIAMPFAIPTLTAADTSGVIGSVVLMAVLAVAITWNRQRSERARIATLLENELFLQRLTHELNQYYWLLDPRSLKPIYLSPGAAAFYGIPEEQQLADPDLTRNQIHPEDRERVLDLVANARTQPYEVRYRMIDPDGRIYWLREHGYPLKDATGRVTRIGGVTEDITEQVAAEQALANSEALFSASFASNPAGMVLSKLRGPVTTINAKFTDILGYAPKDVLGRTATEIGIFAGLDEELERLRAILRSEGRVANTVSRQRHKDGHLVDVIYSAEIVNARGEALLLSMLVDVSAAEQARRALEFQSGLAARITAATQRLNSDSTSPYALIPTLLEQIGQYLNAEICTLSLADERRTGLEDELAWFNPTSSVARKRTLKGTPVMQFRWIAGQLLSGKPVLLRSLADLPPDATGERERFAEVGFIPQIIIPAQLVGQYPVYGIFFVVGDLVTQPTFDTNVQQLLGTLANAFVAAIARHRAGQSLESQLIVEQAGNRIRRAFIETPPSDTPAAIREMLLRFTLATNAIGGVVLAIQPDGRYQRSHAWFSEPVDDLLLMIDQLTTSTFPVARDLAHTEGYFTVDGRGRYPADSPESRWERHPHFHSTLGVFIHLNSHWAGAVLVFAPRQPVYNWQPHEVRLVQLLAETIATTIDRQSTRDALDARLAYEHTVTELLADLIRMEGPQVETNLAAVLKRAAHAMHADCAVLVQYDPTRPNWLRTHYAADPADPMPRLIAALRLADLPTIAADLDADGLIAVSTLADLTGTAERQWAATYGFRGTLGVALPMPEGRAAYLAFFHPPNLETPWGADDRQLTRTLADLLTPILERDYAERALQAEQDHVRAILRAFPDVLLRFDQTGRYTAAYAGNPNDLIAPPELIVGKTIDELLPPDVSAKLHAYIAAAVETGDVQVYEYSLPTAAGVHYEARTVMTDQGELISVVRNITERKQAEADLQTYAGELEQRAHYEQAINDLLALLIRASQTGLSPALTAVLTRAAQFLQADCALILEIAESASGQHLAVFTADPADPFPAQTLAFRLADFPTTMALLAQQGYIAIGVPDDLPGEAEQEWQVRNGFRGVIMVNLPLPDTQLTQLVFARPLGVAQRWTADDLRLARTLADLLTPVLERDRAQRALLEQEANQRAILKAFPDIIMRFDHTGHYLDIDVADPRELFVPRAQLIGQNMLDFLPADLRSLTERAMTAAIATGEMQVYEYVLPTAAGDHYEARMVTTERGELVSIIRNITDRKLAEARMRAYAHELEQRNRDLQDFAYVASHDLQEPLRKIVTFGERLEATYTEVIDARGRDYLLRMTAAAERMQHLRDDLLIFSRVSASVAPRVPVNLNATLADVRADLTLRFEETGGQLRIDEPLPTVIGDPVQLRQLFQNLVSNALKFTASERVPQVRIYPIVPTEAPGVLLCVADNGIGFDPAYAERIFGVFQRLHGRGEYPGTGMGLAICRKIVEQHGGRIWAEGQPNAGARFFIHLPQLSPPSEAPPL